MRRSEQLGELLRQSVRRSVVADVPVGVFLSGGVDSSLSRHSPLKRHPI